MSASFLTFMLKKVVFVLVLLAAALIFFGYGIQDTELTDFRITSLESISEQELVFTAQLTLHNPSKLAIPITRVPYNATLQSTGEVISEGNIGSFILQAGQTTTELQQSIRWSPTAQLLTELLLEDEVLLLVQGEVQLRLPLLDTITLPFEEEVNIKEQLQTIVLEELNEVEETINDRTSISNDTALSETINSLI
ncbi:MAG: LEA type 2 family protein [Candidatus Woesearchaeota archaeon]